MFMQRAVLTALQHAWLDVTHTHVEPGAQI